MSAKRHNFLSGISAVPLLLIAAIVPARSSEFSHWSLRPVVRPPIPQTTISSWDRNPIDQFVRVRLEKEKLIPSGEADRRTLIRRLSFDLIGLPPGPEEVEAFLADHRPDAYERLVERLLASPHYGERWGRHWLDVVRFAESHGFEMNQPRPTAWHYRDYVIRSFNEDKPYDRFIVEQLAGDLLGVDEATGFIVAGPADQVKSPDPELTAQQRMDELHDMVGTTSSTFLGLTVGCARCHDHKFDPITQVDYYNMQALFSGVHHGERELKPPDYTERAAKAEGLRKEEDRINRDLAAFEPVARLRPPILIDDDPALSAAVRSLKAPAAGVKFDSGTARGETGDPGDATRLPTLSSGAQEFPAGPDEDVFVWNLRTSGWHRIWISWACGRDELAGDARYLIDADGELATREDQTLLAEVDQREFAGGGKPAAAESLWSGFHHAGLRELSPSSCLVLRNGDGAPRVSADLILLEPAEAFSGRSPLMPHLRPPVTRAANTDRFPEVEARFVRFTVRETSQLEPCLDELEVFTAETEPRNIALAAAGARATASSTLPGYEIHKLEHVNDGRYGNDHSWISNERGKGWVQIEFSGVERIDRVVWSRDRLPDAPGRYHDRLATAYQIDVSTDGQTWRTVASSQDRLPQNWKVKVRAIYSASDMAADGPERFNRLAGRKRALLGEIKELTAFPTAYSGQFKEPGPTFRLYRGEATQPREEVSPGGVSAITPRLELPPDAPESIRRLQLARWIVSPSNPLTARVMANRIWHYHFGHGLTSTPSDLGAMGARPSHGELLDWLASEFIRQGWSVKALHRLILTSASYRQSSDWNAAGAKVDAKARLLWRFPPRRLEAEAIRDSILRVSGSLDRQMGGPGYDPFQPNNNYVRIYTPREEFGPAEWRRMVYQQRPRMQQDGVFGVFDCPDGAQIAPRRTSSTTPLQALNLLNSEFVIQQAGFFARRLEKEAGPQAAAQARRAFHLAFQRFPDPDEEAAAIELIGSEGNLVFCRALLNASEFLYVF